jgi:hypothetical protein
MILCPFAASLTVERNGIARSILIVRMAGACFLLCGIVFVVGALI